jgi:hypothetical protein
LRDLATGSLVHELDPTPRDSRKEFDEPSSIVFSPDGRFLACGGGDTALKVWDVATGELIHTLVGDLTWSPVLAETGQVTSLDFSSASNLLAAGSDEYGGAVRIWDLDSGHMRHSLSGRFRARILAVLFSPDAEKLAAGASDGIRVWDVETGELLHFLGEDEGSLGRFLSFSPDGAVLMDVGTDGRILQGWSVHTGAEVELVHGALGRCSAGCWVRRPLACTNSLIATGSGDGDITVRDSTSRELVQVLRGHTNMVSSLAFTSDSATLVSGSWDGTVKQWRLGRSSRQGTAPSQEEEPVQVSPVASPCLEVIGRFDELLAHLDVRNGEVLERYGAPPLQVLLRDDRGILDPRIQEIVEGLETATKGLDGVRSVRSPLSAAVITGTEEQVQVRHASPGGIAPVDAADREAYRDRVHANADVLLSDLISRDLKSAYISIDSGAAPEYGSIVPALIRAAQPWAENIEQVKLIGWVILGQGPHWDHELSSSGERFTGRIRLSVEVDAGRRDGLKHVSVLQAMESLEGHLVASGASQVRSLAGVVKEMNLAFNGNDPRYRRIPDTSKVAAQLLFLCSGPLGDLAMGNFSTGLVEAEFEQASCDELAVIMEGISTWSDGVFPDHVDVRVARVAAELELVSFGTTGASTEDDPVGGETDALQGDSSSSSTPESQTEVPLAGKPATESSQVDEPANLPEGSYTLEPPYWNAWWDGTAFLTADSKGFADQETGRVSVLADANGLDRQGSTSVGAFQEILVRVDKATVVTVHFRLRYTSAAWGLGTGWAGVRALWFVNDEALGTGEIEPAFGWDDLLVKATVLVGPGLEQVGMAGLAALWMGHAVSTGAEAVSGIAEAVDAVADRVKWFAFTFEAIPGETYAVTIGAQATAAAFLTGYGRAVLLGVIDQIDIDLSSGASLI